MKRTIGIIPSYLAVVVLLGACGDDRVAPVTLAQLVAAAPSFDGERVETEGVLNRFADPEHYWLEDEDRNRVAVLPGELVEHHRGEKLRVVGRFSYHPDAGRRIELDAVATAALQASMPRIIRLQGVRVGQWLDVVRAGTIEDGDHLVVETDATEIAVFNLGGEYFAVENRCTHADAPIADGELDADDCITCPMHQARFCLRTGEVVEPPAEAPLARYPVRIESGMVQVGTYPLD